MTHKELVLQQYFEATSEYIGNDSRWFKWVRDTADRIHKEKKCPQNRWWRASDEFWRKRESARRTVNTLASIIQYKEGE
jgi:hypothetical protein